MTENSKSRRPRRMARVCMPLLAEPPAATSPALPESAAPPETTVVPAIHTSTSAAAVPVVSDRGPSKTTIVLALLQRPEGATLDQLIAATGWLPHSARAAPTGLRKKGHAITSEKANSDPKVYRIVGNADLDCRVDTGAENQPSRTRTGRGADFLPISDTTAHGNDVVAGAGEPAAMTEGAA